MTLASLKLQTPSGGRRGALLLLIFSVLVGLELATRIDDWLTYGTPFLNRFRGPEELVVRTATGMHGRPAARYQHWTMNALGFRGPEADSAKRPGHFRVIAAGASEMFGLYESRGHEVPRQLEDSLKARLAATCGSAAAEVWNGALPGMTLPTITQDVRLRVIGFDPDVVVLYATPAFYLGGRAPQAARPDSTGILREPGLARAFYPRGWARVRDQLKGLTPEIIETWLRARRVEQVVRRRGSAWRYTELPADRVAEFESELRRFVGAVRGIGAEVVLATHGNAFASGSLSPALPGWRVAWEKFHPRATADVLVAFDSAARAAVLRVAADSGVVAADVADRLAQAPRTGFADYAHFNDLGAAIAAGAMAEGTMTVITRTHAGCARDAHL
jgi:hypothetical protein